MVARVMMEGKKGRDGNWGLRAGRVVSCTLLTLRAKRQGNFAKPGRGYPEGVLFPWRSEL